MNVRCERCNTEYEFDDALVSGRGTTVKCTQCGHKFKIRRADADYAEDFWNVQTSDGRTLVFTSLRELQRSIQAGHVVREDLLSRGGLQHKPLGQIPELSPFFEAQTPRATSYAPGAHLSPFPLGALSAATEPQPEEPQPTEPTRPEPAPVPSLAPALPEVPPEPVPSPRMMSMPAPPRPIESTHKTLTGTGEHRIAGVAAVVASLPPVPTIMPVAMLATSSAPPPTESARGASLTFSEPLVTRERRVEAPSVSDVPNEKPRVAIGHALEAPQNAPRRSFGTALVVGALVVVVGAVVWSQGHLGTAVSHVRDVVSARDPRVDEMVSAGEVALASERLEAAKESFDKASVLAPEDPRVLVGLARYAVLRADLEWLKALLLPADAEDLRATQAAVEELRGVARTTADAALKGAPNDPAALRASIDARRLAGDRDGTRALVGGLSATSLEPATALTLAELDMAEANPPWPTVIERLRLAVAQEAPPGRARVALAYALARSGNVKDAQAETARIAARPKPHPLLALVRAYCNNAVSAPLQPGVAVENPATASDAATHADAGARRETDVRKLVAQGSAARARHDYAAADERFAAVLAFQPENVEALYGVASVIHARRNLPGARAAYQRVLSTNSSFVPALVGLGDVELESGDRAAAMKIYKDIVDRFPSGTYPAHVRQRLSASEPSTPNVAPTHAPSPQKAPPSHSSFPSPQAPTERDFGGGG
jgi:predicted Zn finger-like uncharacterized protein